MKLVRILLPIDQGGTTEACAEAGHVLAKRFGAELAVLHASLAAWQRLNVCAFLMSGIVGGADHPVVGPDYEDASGRRYLPMLVQPVLVFEAGAAKLRTVYERAVARDLRFAIYTGDLFATGKDEDNRAAVRAAASDQLDLVGIALRAPHKAVDGVVRGLKRHP